MKDVVYDLETNDPDDLFTLCLLAAHPEVNLLGVTIVPGSKHQISLVKHVLKLLGKDIPVAGRNIDHPKECVSGFHYKWLGKIAGEDNGDGTPVDILKSIYDSNPDTIQITGAPLHNIYEFIMSGGNIKTWMAQGGFVGSNIIPEDKQLEKFKGMVTCPTFNLGGNKKASIYLVNCKEIESKFFVSKNICHGMIYDNEMHEIIKPFRYNNAGINMIYEGMTKYLNKKSEGKKFHDPLAACTAIDNSICEFEDVELYYQKGKWGSRKSDNINVKISIDVDKNKFLNVLVGGKNEISSNI